MTRKSSDGSQPKTQSRRDRGEVARDGFSRVPLKMSPDGMILRENFTPARMRRLRAEMVKAGDNSVLTEEEREANRRAFLSRWDGRSDLWVFGYGSLMWNPAIHVAETQAAKIHGLHRSFCLHLRLGRGTPDRPGLMLALDHGGSCRGMAHRIAAHHVESETEILWMREMLSGAYRPVWLNIQLADYAEPVRGFTYVINRDNDRYAGKIEPEKIARSIARAEGRLGTNRAYLYRTVERLDALGIGDGPMHRLCARVRTLAKD